MTNSAQRAILGRLTGGENLALDEARSAVAGIMAGEWPEGEIGLFLTLLRDKGETADEIAGAALAMRGHMRKIHTSRTGIIDTCGTGGVGSEIFNVSTTAALVVAACGVPVAKHGNRKVTSRSGSADVLMELGVNVQAAVPVVEQCLEELGICFCFAPLMHTAMKHVAPVRQKLGTRTIFNLLGPLTNPAGAEYQLLGVGRSELRPLLASALQRLGAKRAVVAGGSDGLGEVTITGPTEVCEVASFGGAAPSYEVKDFRWTPADFDVPVGAIEPITIDSPAASAALVREVLRGAVGPARDIVVVNAAAALWTANRAPTTATAAALARTAIDSGAAAKLLEDLVRLTNA